MNQNFYITFGSDRGFPYPNKYLAISAPDIKTANQIFRTVFLDRYEGMLNYSFIYKEKEWKSINDLYLDNYNKIPCAGNIELLPNGMISVFTIDKHITLSFQNIQQEISSMITLSTAHITPEIADKLTNQTLEEDISYFQKNEYGFFFPVIDEFTPKDPILQDLFAYAKANNCKWICLDQDDPVMDDLKTYDWDKDIEFE